MGGPIFFQPVSAKNDGSKDFALLGVGDTGIGVRGSSQTTDAIVGHTFAGSNTVWASGVVGVNRNFGRGAFAGYFEGKIYVSNSIAASNYNSKIDHPIDPANKYLNHSSVESSDMKNLYDGVVTLDDKGGAVIDLPDWFSALNKDFCYNLTAIGAPSPNLHIAEEISEASTGHKNSFKIAGGTSGMKVSWQVTGVRMDPWANANRIQVEEDKSEIERGLYIHPQSYGMAEEKGITLDNLRKHKVGTK